MEIKLKQADIEAAIKAHLVRMGITRPVTEMNFIAGRRGAGTVVEIEVSDTDLPPVQSGPVARTVTASAQDLGTNGVGQTEPAPEKAEEPPAAKAAPKAAAKAKPKAVKEEPAPEPEPEAQAEVDLDEPAYGDAPFTPDTKTEASNDTQAEKPKANKKSLFG